MIVADILTGAIRGAVEQVVRSPLNNAPREQSREIASQVIQEVRQNPVVKEIVAKATHATNSEPWYQSRVTIGALVSMGAGAAGLFGFAVSPEDAEAIIGITMAAGTAVGGAITLYGRWVAKKPIGA